MNLPIYLRCDRSATTPPNQAGLHNPNAQVLKLHTSIYPRGIKAISRWHELSEHHRRTMKVQIDPEGIAAYEAVIPIGMKVSKGSVPRVFTALDPGLMA